MKTMMLFVMVAATAAATPAAGQSFAHGWNDGKNEYDAARWRREAEKAGIAPRPADTSTVKGTAGPGGYLPPEAGSAAKADEPEAPAPKSAQKPARKPAQDFANPFAAPGPQRVAQDARQAGRDAVRQAGTHAKKIPLAEIKRRGRVAAGKARLTGDDADSFVQEFVAGFDSALTAGR